MTDERKVAMALVSLFVTGMDKPVGQLADELLEIISLEGFKLVRGGPHCDPIYLDMERDD